MVTGWHDAEKVRRWRSRPSADVAAGHTEASSGHPAGYPGQELRKTDPAVGAVAAGGIAGAAVAAALLQALVAGVAADGDQAVHKNKNKNCPRKNMRRRI